MSALEAFVNEQKKKNGGSLSNSTGGMGLGLPSSASFASLGDFRSKLSSSLSGIPLLSRTETVEIESLNGEASSGDGQLPGGKNRKNTSGGWLGSWGAAASEESYFGMSRTQRMFAFFLSLIAAGFCFITAAMLLPVLILQTRKFAALNTLGSVLLLASFGFLWGPSAFLTHLLSPSRRLVTVAYFSALFAALYTSLWLQSTLFTLIASIFELCTLVWFVLSYVPGGERGLRFLTSIFTGVVSRGSSTVLPI